MTKNRTPVYLDPGMHPGLEVKGLKIQIQLLHCPWQCSLDMIDIELRHIFYRPSVMINRLNDCFIMFILIALLVVLLYILPCKICLLCK